MVVNLGRVGWVRIVGAALVAFVGSMVVTMLVVTGYAFMLGFQARGAPDQTRISAFAREVGPTWGPVLLWVFTAFAALRVARWGTAARSAWRSHRSDAATIGLMTGWPPDLRDAAFFAAIMGGWRTTLVIVKPETVIAWHRRDFRRS
jgi:hypothetical protein